MPSGGLGFSDAPWSHCSLKTIIVALKRHRHPPLLVVFQSILSDWPGHPDFARFVSGELSFRHMHALTRSLLVPPPSTDKDGGPKCLNSLTTLHSSQLKCSRGMSLKPQRESGMALTAPGSSSNPALHLSRLRVLVNHDKCRFLDLLDNACKAPSREWGACGLLKSEDGLFALS
jgi:hypothetical protein